MTMRKPFLIIIAGIALLLQGAHAPVATEPGVGLHRMQVASPERGQPVDVTVWYPASAGGEEIMVGDTPFFVGSAARLDAPVADGRFPLILLSHGAGLAGNADAMSWIAAPLARSGFVVAAPTHPGNSGPGRSAAETMKLWLRPADITRTLDAVERTDLFEKHLAAGRIGVLGLSMGGSTALALAGARFDPMLLSAYCDQEKRNPSFCGWVRQSGVDLHAMDMTDAGGDYRDQRIRFAMAIDPVPTDVFDAASLPAIGIPVDLVNLGRPGTIAPTAQASNIAEAIAGADYAVIGDASHFSMFGECRPDAAEAALSEGIEDAICSDGTGESRRAIHRRLLEMVERAFHAAFADREPRRP